VGSAWSSWLREVMSSLVNTLPRWYPLGERGDAHRLQHADRGAQLLPRVAAAALPAQPFPGQPVKQAAFGPAADQSGGLRGGRQITAHVHKPHRN